MTVDETLKQIDVVLPSPIQRLEHPLFLEKNVSFYVKRDDLIHQLISGNKWRKLKYNLFEAEKLGKNTLLSFGGAYSNHIHALAAAGNIFNFKTIGFIRGEESRILNPTLEFAKQQGMELLYIDRQTYRKKADPEFLSTLKKRFPGAYVIPEGGSNKFALSGCAEIIDEINLQLNNEEYCVATAVGSGGTIAGLLSHESKPTVLGVAVLKGADFLRHEINSLLERDSARFSLALDYHFGGYAKADETLVRFVNDFKHWFDINIEPIYTGKLFFALFELIKKDYFKPGTRIVAIHTGGMQGYQP